MDISEIISSKSSFKILQVLSKSSVAFPLRLLSSLTHLPVHSVEKAMKRLEKIKVVKSTKQHSLRLCSINDKHPLSFSVRKIFEILEELQLKTRSEKYQTSAIQVLSFCDSAQNLFKTINK